MGKKLYIGNLPFTVTNQQLQEMFSEIGTVKSVKIITDRDTGRARGFAFVEMENHQEAINAINTLNGREYDGRVLTVAEARPQNSQGKRPFRRDQSNRPGNRKRW